MPLSVYEQVPEYTIEPELSRLAPRRIRIAAWPTLVVACCASLFLLVICASGFIAVHSVAELWLARSGVTQMARVSGCDFADGGVGPCSLSGIRTVVRVDYRFGPNGSFTGSAPAGLVAHQAVPPLPPPRFGDDGPDLSRPPISTAVPSPIPARIPIRFAIWSRHAFSCPVRALAVRSLVIGLAVSALASTIAAALCVRFVRWLQRTVDLLRCGQIAVATIVSKEIRESDLPRYFVTYGFVDLEDTPRERCERCTPEQWRKLEIGDEATVLFPAAQPSRAELYAHLPLRCA